MVSRPKTNQGWWQRHHTGVISIILSAVVIPTVLAWSGVLDIRLVRWINDDASAETPEGAWLATNSPVKVYWTGRGDTIELYWDLVEYPDLHYYSVDVYGLAPIETWYNVGYPIGEDLRTSDITNPISLSNEYFAEYSKPQRVTNDQTWRACVTGMREPPDGVDVTSSDTALRTPYIIEQSERCSDPFTIPTS